MRASGDARSGAVHPCARIVLSSVDLRLAIEATELGTAANRLVSADYFGAPKQAVQRGREFTADDKTGNTLVAIVTPGIAAKLWPGENPSPATRRVGPFGPPGRRRRAVSWRRGRQSSAR
jgi:hypothetical protein